MPDPILNAETAKKTQQSAKMSIKSLLSGRGRQRQRMEMSVPLGGFSKVSEEFPFPPSPTELPASTRSELAAALRRQQTTGPQSYLGDISIANDPLINAVDPSRLSSGTRDAIGKALRAPPSAGPVYTPTEQAAMRNARNSAANAAKLQALQNSPAFNPGTVTGAYFKDPVAPIERPAPNKKILSPVAAPAPQSSADVVMKQSPGNYVSDIIATRNKSDALARIRGPVVPPATSLLPEPNIPVKNVPGAGEGDFSPLSALTGESSPPASRSRGTPSVFRRDMDLTGSDRVAAAKPGLWDRWGEMVNGNKDLQWGIPATLGVGGLLALASLLRSRNDDEDEDY